VVIKYDPSLTSSAAILDSLRDLGYIRNVDVLNQPYAAHSLQKVADIFVQKLMETALERSAVALVAALI
jgi:hypothetical protein